MTQDNDTYVRGITSARVRSLIAGAFGLLSIRIGWRTRAHAGNASVTLRWSDVALRPGLIAVFLSTVHLLEDAGEFGTGSGKAGVTVALVPGIIGSTVAVLVLRPKSN